MSDSAMALVVAAVLIIVAGVLAAVETAVGRISRSRVDEITKESPARGARLRPIVQDRARYVNVLLFLQLVCSTVAVLLVGLYFFTVWPDRTWNALIVAALVMVVVAYIVLGVAPRTLGRQYAEGILSWSAGPTRFVATLLSPLTRLLILVGNAVTPGKGYREGPFSTTAELRELVDLAEADMLIEDDERRMIHSVFELGDTYAREVMVPRTDMVFIESDKTLRQAVSLGLRSGYSRIPVVGKDVDDVVGVAYLKDIVRRVFDDRQSENTMPVGSLMRQAFFVPDSKRVDVLLREMQAERVHLAIVVDEYGGTAGIVTIEDVLEEIVGEIDDEYDTAAPEVQALDGGAYLVSARMNVDDFAELLRIEIDSDEEGIDTVGGLMGKRLGRVPIPGAEIEIEGYNLRAERTEGRRNRLGLVRVAPVGSDSGSDDD